MEGMINWNSPSLGEKDLDLGWWGRRSENPYNEKQKEVVYYVRNAISLINRNSISITVSLGIIYSIFQLFLELIGFVNL